MEAPLSAVLDFIRDIGAPSALSCGLVYIVWLCLRALLAQIKQERLLAGILECGMKQAATQEENRQLIDSGFQQNRVAVAAVAAAGEDRHALLTEVLRRLEELKTMVAHLEQPKCLMLKEKGD